MNLKKIKHIHFTGIKGVGMASLALCIKDLGIKVTGSDVEEVFVTDETLRKANIKWKVGFSEKNLDPLPELLITTGAWGGLSNPEVVAAKKRGVRVMTHAEALGNLSRDKDVIAVCGVGGKTTTCSIISVLLDTAGMKPCFAVGVGDIDPLGVPGRYDRKGKHFICEADEYAVSKGINNNPRFSYLSPKFLIVSNIEHDHPDIYPTFNDTKRTFKDYFKKIDKQGLLVACIDNSNVRSLVRNLQVPVQTYGFDKKADWKIENVLFKKGETRYWVKGKNQKPVEITINIPGRFNVQNATAAYVVGKFLKLDNTQLKNGLKKYLGCRRRFEKMGEYKNALFFDDYAHHPKEIRSTLKAAREWFGKTRIVAIFQPHTYSRTKALFNEFSKSFTDADCIALMDVYASAREKDDLGVSSSVLVKEIKKHKKDVYYSKGQKETIKWIGSNVKKGDVVLTMGAGDIFHLYIKLMGRKF
jgi:UDP-N-acetylmuramate--alanine ligase